MTCHAMVVWAPAVHAVNVGGDMEAAAAWMEEGSPLTVSNAQGLPRFAREACRLHALRTEQEFAAAMLK